MSLRIPEPLPYDYVDEYIDSQFFFTDSKEYYDGASLIAHHCEPRMGTGRNQSFPQLMIDLKEDSYYETDPDGYLTEWNGSGDSMYWIAEWSDEDTEEYLNTQIYY